MKTEDYKTLKIVNVKIVDFKIAQFWRLKIWQLTKPENWRFAFLTWKIWLLSVINWEDMAPGDTSPRHGCRMPSYWYPILHIAPWVGSSEYQAFGCNPTQNIWPTSSRIYLISHLKGCHQDWTSWEGFLGWKYILIFVHVAWKRDLEILGRYPTLISFLGLSRPGH